jgi:hypothetical protein
MEKFGMDRNLSYVWTGLLVLLLFSVSAFVHADDDERDFPQPLSDSAVPLEEAEVWAEVREIEETPPMESERLVVEVVLSSERPVVNTRWTISILVDYPHPGYVSVTPPELPEALRLDEMRIEPLIRENRRRWTAVSWTFIPQRLESDEAVRLGSFQITVPGKAAFTEAMDVYILSSPSVGRIYRPRLIWDKVATPFEAGVGGGLFLRLLDWNPLLPTPEISVTAPEGAILEELPLTQADLARSVVLRLFLIPLMGGGVTIPSVRFEKEGVDLEIPSLDVPTVSLVKREVALETAEAVLIEETTERSGEGRFPVEVLKVSGIISRIVDGVVEKAKALWDRGETAEALALVRRNERYGLFGFVLAPLREGMEQALGLIPSHKERRIPKIVCFMGIFCCLLGLTVFFVKRKGWKRDGRSGLFAVILAILGIVGLVGLWEPFWKEAAVFRGTNVYSVPEPDCVVTGRIKEGQWAIIRSELGDWILVEADDIYGWVLLEKAIMY